MQITKKSYVSAGIAFTALLLATSVFAATLNNDPQDRATLRVMNFTQSGVTNSQWSTGTTGNPGDIISFAIYYHVTSSDAAQDLRVRLNPQSTGAGSSQTFYASVWASNASPVSGTASVTISSPQSMAFVPGSLLWRPNQTVSGSQSLPYGQDGSEIFNTNGLRLGNIPAGWPTQGSVVLHFKIDNQIQQQQLPTVSLSANPLSVSQGQSATLTWSSTNADSCYASFGWWGTKPLSGSETVYPQTIGNNIYRITCSNSAGSRTAEAVVSVNQNVPNIDVRLTANTTNVSAGSPVTLSWYSNNANSCYAVNGWSGTKQLSGSEVVYPNTTTTYTIVCTGYNNQQQSDSVTVTVNQATPNVSITANPTQIYQGGSSVLVWNSTNANSCYGSGGWSGYKNVSGSQTVYPSVTSTYTIVCTGSNGAQTQSSVTVSVIPSITPPAPSFTTACVASPTVVRVGQRVSFTAGVSGETRPVYYSWSGAASGNAETVSTWFTTSGTKTAYLTVRDSSGRVADTSCTVKVLPQLVVTPPPTPPCCKVPPPPCYCVPVNPNQYPNPYSNNQSPTEQYPQNQWQGQNPGNFAPVPNLPQDQNPSQGTTVDNSPKTPEKTDRSVLASMLLADDGTPRTGVMFIFYLFLLSVVALVIFFLYSLIVGTRRNQ